MAAVRISIDQCAAAQGDVATVRAAAGKSVDLQVVVIQIECRTGSVCKYHIVVEVTADSVRNSHLQDTAVNVGITVISVDTTKCQHAAARFC